MASKYILKEANPKRGHSPIRITIKAPKFIFGRETVPAFRNKLMISRKHAAFHQTYSGQLIVEDLDSTHGLFLNGKKILKKQFYAVKTGDTLQFGAGDNATQHGFIAVVNPAIQIKQHVINITDNDDVETVIHSHETNAVSRVNFAIQLPGPFQVRIRLHKHPFA